MTARLKLSPLHFGLFLAVLDTLWAAQAFRATSVNLGSNVALVSLIVWAVFHLPSAALAGLLLRPFGVLDHGADGLPAWALGVMAAMGILQTLLLGWALAAWWRRRKPA